MKAGDAASKTRHGRRRRAGAPTHKISSTSLLAAALALASCSVELENRKPAQELARAAEPPGSVYTGWRLFQQHCARCHGSDAGGTSAAPGLPARVGAMGPRQFVDLVLRRYEWIVPAEHGGGDSAARETLAEEIVQRKDPALSMPAWRGEPNVDAHILDLYAYLAARADGTQGPGRPSR
ncbi:MAG TPA: c-type cytochrome [Rubrivivax sp.]|nr:c-type cytochrome [Pseudomonadota bacterium]HPP82079.1 c-type cytochrome [Rubrivivax sp.]